MTEPWNHGYDYREIIPVIPQMAELFRLVNYDNWPRTICKITMFKYLQINHDKSSRFFFYEWVIFHGKLWSDRMFLISQRRKGSGRKVPKLTPQQVIWASRVSLRQAMGVPLNGWMVAFMENPSKKWDDDDWGVAPWLRKPPYGLHGFFLDTYVACKFGSWPGVNLDRSCDPLWDFL